jgi:hypothetical protein
LWEFFIVPAGKKKSYLAVENRYNFAHANGDQSKQEQIDSSPARNKHHSIFRQMRANNNFLEKTDEKIKARGESSARLLKMLPPCFSF